jgi:hypothetical protein
MRREIDPDMEVEVLDVNEEEARELLLSIDPLAEMAQVQEQLYERLRETAPAVRPELAGMWEEAARQSLESLGHECKPIAQRVGEQYMVLVMCKDEKQQLTLLERFQGEGLACKALLS